MNWDWANQARLIDQSTFNCYSCYLIFEEIQDSYNMTIVPKSLNVWGSIPTTPASQPKWLGSIVARRYLTAVGQWLYYNVRYISLFSSSFIEVAGRYQTAVGQRLHYNIVLYIFFLNYWGFSWSKNSLRMTPGVGHLVRRRCFSLSTRVRARVKGRESAGGGMQAVIPPSQSRKKIKTKLTKLDQIKQDFIFHVGWLYSNQLRTV